MDDKSVAVVTGCRDWADRWLVYSALGQLQKSGLIVCHGGAGGADMFAHEYVKWANEQGFKVEERVFEAEWNLFGKGAGPVRNAAMIREVEAMRLPTSCFAFWDGKSPGTLDCMKRMVAAGFNVEVISKCSEEYGDKTR